MVFKKFETNIIARTIALTCTCILFAFTIYKEGMLYTTSALFLFIVLQAWLFIYYLQSTNRRIVRFIEYIKENNTSLTIKNRNHPFHDLNSYFDELNQIIRKIKLENVNQYHYLHSIIENVNTGLIAFHVDGRVEMVNSVAKNILKIKTINNIAVLQQIYTDFPTILITLRPQDQRLITIHSNHEILNIAIRISIIKLQNSEIRLASLQNIKAELDEKELESWQKLIRVLTHELNNSVTPITSLTSTITKFYKEGDRIKTPAEIDESVIEDTIYGLNLIEERGNGLMSFVNKYRSLTKLPKPEFSKMMINSLFDRILTLKNDDIHKNQIKLIKSVTPDNLTLVCDKHFIEQILINLINNSIDSFQDVHCETEKIIELQAGLSPEQSVFIQVIDNGKGIPEEIIEQIFIPFFTTKDNGSGIGLSLSKQMMKLHNGTISVHSKSFSETVFTLKF